MLFEYILHMMQSVLTFLVVAVVWSLVKLLNRFVDEKKRKLIAEIVADGVRCVQEKYEHLPGEDRYASALTWIRTELEKRNIRLTEAQLDAMIHSVLKALKLEFGESWWQTTKTRGEKWRGHKEKSTDPTSTVEKRQFL